ncbi:MAG: M48 family metalloprotease [Solirubrobacteraceae bacterium]
MRRSWRLPVALVTAVLVAEGAVVLMRPRDRGPEPVRVEPRAYFSAAQIDRAEAFRTGQLWIYVAQTAIGLGVLALLVRRPPERVAALNRPTASRKRSSPASPRAGAAVAAAIAIATGVAGLPLSAVARERAKDVGLVTQDWTGWAGDVAKSQAIGAGFAALGGAVLVLGMRRFGSRWWLPGAVVVVAFGAITTYAGPVVLDPLFNEFTPLPRGELRSDVLRLAREAGVDVGQVYVIDASRRTTAANAYVNGLGHTKRVVLYDNLIDDFTPAETRLVVAHELGHVRHQDMRGGLIWLAVVAPFGMWAAALLAERFAPRGAALGPRAVPAVALSIAIVVPVITVVSNQLSRDVERRADAFSLELTRDPETFVAFQERIAVKNVSDPDPPGLARFLLGTHPSTIERIGQAEAFGR